MGRLCYPPPYWGTNLVLKLESCHVAVFLLQAGERVRVQDIHKYFFVHEQK